MRRLMIAVVCVVAVTGTAWAQSGPGGPPIQNRIGCFGYDSNLKNVAGDLTPIGSQSGDGSNDGFVGVWETLPGSVLFTRGGMWVATIKIGSAWYPKVFAGGCIYYQPVGVNEVDTHDWMEGGAAEAVRLVDLPDMSLVILRGWDGNICIPGDLTGCVPNDGLIGALYGQKLHYMGFAMHDGAGNVIGGVGPGVLMGKVDLVKNHQGVPETVWFSCSISHCGVQ